MPSRFSAAATRRQPYVPREASKIRRTCSARSRRRAAVAVSAR
ncbi:hypothetical protein V6U90_30660 [Micromonospora sp. CPCC 206060]